jgi:hypothetical protein
MKRLDEATISEVRSVPAVLSAIKATEGAFGQAVLIECLRKTPQPAEWRYTTQLLWTTWAASKTAQHHAATRARLLCDDRGGPIGDKLALAGIAYLGQLGGQPLTTVSADEVETWMHDEAEEWASARTQSDVQLASLGICLVAGRPHRSFVRRLQDLAGSLAEERSSLPFAAELTEAVERFPRPTA